MARHSKESTFIMIGRLIFFALSAYTAVVFSKVLFAREKQVLTLFFSNNITEALLFICSFTAYLVCRDIARKRPSDYLSYSNILKSYLFNRVLYVLGWRFYRILTGASKNVENVQRDWLMRSIQTRKDTVFGKEHGFDGIKSVEDFRRKIPISGYDYFEKYVERAARGEDNVLTTEKTVYVILTSGTTGKNKKFPLCKSAMTEFFKTSIALPTYITSWKEPSSVCLKKPLLTWVTPTVIKNEYGLRMGAVSGCRDFDPGSTTPYSALKEIKNELTLMYVHGVFGLLYDDVEQIGFTFVTLARSFFITLETRWEDIVHDIETGALNSGLDITPKLRMTLEQKMWKNPARAAELHREFSKGFQSIVPRVWPMIHHVCMLSSGTLQTASLTLQEKYFPGVPVWDSYHSASEGGFGVCLDPQDILDTRFTMMPLSAFFEFIPVEDIDNPDPKTKLMHELKANQQYELCMTTSRGICRYRTGDVIKVVSFFNEIPQYQLVGRHGELLNVCWEKTTEKAFNTALEDTLSEIEDFCLVDYTTADNGSLDSVKGVAENERYYMLFIELETKNGGPSLLTEEQKNLFDENMKVYNEKYKELRDEGRIQQMKVIQTVPGTFTMLKQHLLAANPKTSSNQFKTPRVLKKEVDLCLMFGKAVESGSF